MSASGVPVLLLLLLVSASVPGLESSGSNAVGFWETDSAGLPVFVYTMDEFNDRRAFYPTSLGLSNDHWHLVGNARLVALAYNHGEVVIYSGERGATWLNERDPRHHRYAGGYGFLAEGSTIFSLRYPDRPASCEYERRFGVGYFAKRLSCPDISITQTIFAPPDETTALVSEVKIENHSARERELIWHEYWDVNPHYFGLFPEVAEQGTKSEGEGAGLASLTPLILKISRLIPGEYTLSRSIASLLHHWRSQAWDNFQLKVEYQEKTSSLAALLADPAGGAATLAAGEINRSPPVFFLAPLEPATVAAFETRRRSSFDAAGRFTARLGNEPTPPTPLRKAAAALILGQKLYLEPGETQTLRFLCGYFWPDEPDTPADFMIDKIIRHLKASGFYLFSAAAEKWRELLPQVAVGPGWLNQEMIWHAYYLRALATYDDYFQSRILSQGCAYQYLMGLNIAGRDPLQHLLPVIYLEPALARDILRYTLMEMDSSGFIPYGIKGVGKRTAGGNPFPSDTNLYLMLALTEYVSATRDFAFLAQELPFYPREEGQRGTVLEHMRRAWRHQIEEVGIGANGLVNLRNSDWSDTFVAEVKIQTPEISLGEVERNAESVLNTALAAAVLPRFAALVRAAGDERWAKEIENQAASFKTALRRQWNGQWFNRAILPGGRVVGEDTLFLEPQPWGMLASVLSPEEELKLAETLYLRLSSSSPLGAVQRWPTGTAAEPAGMGTNGGVWFSLRFPLVMSWARSRPDFAWEEFIKMTNHSHAHTYPDIWIGQWSGPDAYNAPGSKAPGWTTDVFPFSGSMMDFPVMCGHAHAAPWFSLLKLLGIQPDPNGFTIDPRLPSETFSLAVELLALERTPSTFRGTITPGGYGPITWRVKVPATPRRITVKGEPADWRMEQGFAVFRMETRNTTEWKIEW